MDVPRSSGYDYQQNLRDPSFSESAVPRPSVYLDDDAFNDDDEVSELTMRQFPRASRYLGGGLSDMRMSSVLKLPTMHLRGPTIYGWLWKKGASFKTWKKRFFLLNGATLTYYTQACVVQTEVGIRCLEMPAKGGLRVASADITDLTQFGLRVTSSSGRVLYLQAGDRASRIKWLGVLQEAGKKAVSDSTIRATRVSDAFKASYQYGSLGSHNSELSVPSSSMSSTLSSDDEDAGPSDMKGWLYIRRRGPSMLRSFFKKRYVTLAHGVLTLTSHQRERRPNDRTHEIISATAWNGHEHGLKLQLGNHKQLFVYANSSDECKLWLQAIHNNL